jgi:hypothetical protein
MTHGFLGVLTVNLVDLVSTNPASLLFTSCDMILSHSHSLFRNYRSKWQRYEVASALIER